MALQQVLVYSDNSGIDVLDVLTGARLATYKTNQQSVGKNCLSLLASDYLCYSESDSALIHFKPIKVSTNNRPIKVICPGIISALATTNVFAIVAIGSKCYIWHISTGDIVAILSKHCRSISVIRTSSDGSSFITGGNDGLVLFWDMASIIRTSGQVNTPDMEPVHSWSGHQDKVTDVTFGSFDTKVASTSIDKSCRIYDTLSGNQVGVIYFPVPIVSIAMDVAGYFVFAGGNDGIIYETKLYEKPDETEFSRISKTANPTFIGHKDSVTTLSVSIDGCALMSSSCDSSLKLWNILAKQCVRTIQVKGTIGNLFTIPTCHGFLPSSSSRKSQENSSSIPRGNKVPISSTFKRVTGTNFNVSSTDEWIESFFTESETGRRKKEKKEESSDKMMKRRFGITNDFSGDGDDDADKKDEKILEEKVEKLQQINSELYHYSIDSLFEKMCS